MPSRKAAELRDLPDDGLRGATHGDEGRAVQPPVPARDRTARQLLARCPQLKREVARINTELRAREIAAAEALETTDG